jgi:hypothetical protein
MPSLCHRPDTPRQKMIAYICLAVRSVAVLFVLAAPAGASADTWQSQRSEARQDRAELRRAADEDQEARARHAEEALSSLFGRVESGEVVVARAELWQLLAGLGRLSPEHLGDLPERLRGMNVAAERSDAMGNSALAATRSSITERPWKLLQRSVEAGQIRLATDYLWEILYFDPDFQPIRRALGHQKVKPDKVKGLRTDQIIGDLADRMPEIQHLHPDRYWFSPFDAARLKQGLWWDDRFGWIDANHPDRYKQGYLFDLQRKKWTTLDEANTYHSKPGRDWQVRTEHMLITGTAELEKLVQVADHLEALYAEVFRTFSAFFTDSRRVDAMRYALGLAEHDPLKVWVYASHDEYVSRADAVGWSGGVFKRSNGEAYFYGGPSTTMYHEFTHQILHVMTGQNSAPSWLAEGIAVYAQTVTFEMQGASFPGASPDGAWSIDDIMALRKGDDWYRAYETAKKNGRPTFSMQVADSSHQTDFIDFLRDSYRGRAGKRAVWDYMGMSEQSYQQAYARWLGQHLKR